MKHVYLAKFPVIAVLALSLIACQGSDDDTDVGDSLADVANPLVDPSELDAGMNAFLSNHAVAGMSVALVRSGDESLFWSGHYGMRDIEAGTPVNGETSFWLGSVSKAVMGTAMMIAKEKGFLQLDDDVQALLAANGRFSVDNPAQTPISLAQLASHTSGIVDEDVYLCAYHVVNDDGEAANLVNLLELGTCPEPGPVTLEDYLGAYLDADGIFYDLENFLAAAPGEEFEYSNIGAALAGFAIELATGQDLATFAAQEIFMPLAMQHTSWRSADLARENIATPYWFEDEDEDTLVALPIYELATWPDGGLRSNAADLAVLLNAVMQDRRSDGTSTQLLSAASVEEMLPPDGEEEGVFWAVEEEVSYAGETHQLVGHTGRDPGAFSFMMFDPESDIGVVVTGNGEVESIDEDDYLALLSMLFENGAALQAVEGSAVR